MKELLDVLLSGSTDIRQELYTLIIDEFDFDQGSRDMAYRALSVFGQTPTDYVPENEDIEDIIL